MRDQIVLQRAAGDRAEAGLNLLSAEEVDGAGLVNCEKRFGRVHRYRFGEGRKLELNRKVCGRGGADFDGLRDGGKSGALNVDAIDAIGKTRMVRVPSGLVVRGLSK